MKTKPVRVVRQRSPSPSANPTPSPYEKGGLRRNRGGIVRRIQRALSLERGWRKKGTGPGGVKYEGYFHAAGMKHHGKATVSRTSIDIYLRHPPPELQLHRHWHCFTPRKDGWFRVHHTRQGSLDSAILEIEAILTECRPRYQQPARHLQSSQGTALPLKTTFEQKVSKFFAQLFR